MAYRAEINVDVRNLNKVSELEAKLSNISRSVNALNRGAGGGGGRRGGGGGGSSEADPLKEELALLKLQNTALGQSNRAIRVKNKLKGENFKLEDALSKLEDIGRGKDTRDIDLLRREVELRKTVVIEAEKTLAATVKTSEAASKIKDVRGLGPSSPVFGRPGQIGSAANMAAINQDPLTSVSPVQRKLQEMEKRSARNKKQAELRRKKSLSIGQSNIKNLKAELRLEKAKGIAANKTADARRRQIQSPQGPFSRLSDRQSRDETGRRTRLNNPIGGLATRLGARRGFDFGSAAISGGFPLLFGQGPGVAAAGALGGGIGGMFGQMGGFAGGIAATAAVQSIQNAVNGVAKLGQAFNKLNPDIEGLVGALGIAGTEEERRIRLIEQAGGKQAALNAITQQMNQVLGEEAVSSLKQFGEATQQIGNAFAVLMLKMQAAIAPFLSQIAKGIQGITGMDRGRVDRLSAGSTRSDSTIFDARNQIKELESQRSGAGRVRVKAINDEIAALNKVISLRKVAIADEKTANLERSNNNKQISLTLEDIEKENRLNQAILNGKGEEFQIEQQITDLIKQTGIEEEKLTEGQKDRIRNAVELNNKLEKQVELTKDIGSNFEIIGESIASGVSDNLTAAIQGTKTLGDAAKSILNDLSSSLIRLGVNTILSGIPGFGGLPKLLGFSKGGRPPVGRPSIVGEKGPELFVPRRSGTIIPNDKLGGGSTNINVNVDATGSSVEGDEQQSKELGRAISAAIQSELLKQRRPGGLLR